MTFEEWCVEFHHRMGHPSTAANLAIDRMWATREGMFNPKGLSFEMGYNPWMTTAAGTLSTLDIGSGPGRWNPQGVKMYASAEAGLLATISTFRDGNGPAWYGALDTAFRTQVWTPAVARCWQIWIVGPNADPSQHDYDVALSEFAQGQWAAPLVILPAAALSDAQTAAVKGLIDGSFGPIFLALLRQVVGLDPSTYGEPFAASVAEVRAALTALQLPPHTHKPGDGPTGGVNR